MNDRPTDPAMQSIRHYEVQDALMKRDGSSRPRRNYHTEAENKAFWESVDRCVEWTERAILAGDIIGYDKFCKPIFA